MHYQLFGSVAVTEEWAGNSKGIVQPFIKGLVTKAQASQFWVMLPSYLHAAGIKVDLPANHNLDSAMTAARVLSVSTAQAAMKSVMAKLAEAKVKAAAKRPAELKTRQAEYKGLPADPVGFIPAIAEGISSLQSSSRISFMPIVFGQTAPGPPAGADSRGLGRPG